MAGGFSIEITGLEAIENYVSTKLAADLKQKITSKVTQVFDQGYDMMQTDVPVRTGRLKRSISKSGAGTGGDDDGIIAEIKVTAPYAGFVNFGYGGRRPHPFATNAYHFMLEELHTAFMSIK